MSARPFFTLYVEGPLNSGRKAYCWSAFRSTLSTAAICSSRSGVDRGGRLQVDVDPLVELALLAPPLRVADEGDAARGPPGRAATRRSGPAAGGPRCPRGGRAARAFCVRSVSTNARTPAWSAPAGLRACGPAPAFGRSRHEVEILLQQSAMHGDCARAVRFSPARIRPHRAQGDRAGEGGGRGRPRNTVPWGCETCARHPRGHACDVRHFLPGWHHPIGTGRQGAGSDRLDHHRDLRVYTLARRPRRSVRVRADSVSAGVGGGPPVSSGSGHAYSRHRRRNPPCVLPAQ